MSGSWPVLPPSGTEKVIDGRYRLRHSLGGGGLGEVFYADDLKTDPPGVVAFKLLHAELLEDQQARADFRREVILMRRLYHPNILRMLGFQLRNDLSYLVMPYAEKGSLQSLLQPNPDLPPRPLSFNQLLVILWQVAEALDYLHRERLVHRDIKPANILLLSDEQVALADFSLTISLNSQIPAALIKADAWGTPLYAAPEIWTDRVGKASDIYSLGVMTYQLITGVTPFEGTPDELKELHRNASVPALSAARGNLVYPAELDDLIAAAMAKEAHKRPASAGEFYRRLSQILDPQGRSQVDSTAWLQGQLGGGSLSGPALPVSGPAVTSSPSRIASIWSSTSQPFSSFAPVQPAKTSNSSGCGAAMLIFFVVMGIALAITSGRGGTTRSTTGASYVPGTPKPVPTFAVTTPATHPFTFNSSGWLRIPEAHNGSVNVVSWISTGSLAFYSGGQDGEIKRWYLVDDEVALLSQPDRFDQPVTALAVTPNLATLAVGLSDGLMTLNTRGDPFPLKFNFHSDTVTSLAWSPNGTLLASASRDKTAYLTTIKGRQVATLTGHTDSIKSVAWSPDGKLLATASSDNTIQIWDNTGAFQTKLTGHTQAVNSVAFSPDGKFLVSGSSDGTVRLWQTAGWQNIKTLTDHQAPVRAVAWQPVAALFASVGDDYKMRFWNSQGQPGAVLYGPSSQINSLSWSADGNYLAAGAVDGSLWLWKTGQYRP